MFIVILKLKARRIIYPKADEVFLIFKWTVSLYNSLIQNPWVFTKSNSPRASSQINYLCEAGIHLSILHSSILLQFPFVENKFNFLVKSTE